MRTSLLAGALLGFASSPALLASCATTPAISVVHLGPGERAEAVRGDPVKIKRGAQEPFASLRGGFFVVRTTEEWHALWAESSKDPAMPPTLDTARSMLVLAVGESKDVVAVRVQKIVDTGEVLEVSVKETKPGEGCVARVDRPAFDAVIVDRIDKPVKFVVEDERGEACGAPPLPEASCRVGDARDWATKLEAKPGDVVECTMTASARGRFEITDRVLRLDLLPGGSSAKLAYTKGPTRGSFTVDVFGQYQVRAEATDDAGRKGTAVVPIDVAPPKTNDVLVELVWSGFDVSDDPETFPRVKLRATDPASKKDCTPDAPIAGACEAKTQGAYTHMKITPGAAAPKKLALSLVYADERIEKGPFACVQTYTNGERTGETCDRKHRDPDDKWEIGALDVAAGKIVDPNAPKTPPAAPRGDAGAGGAGDAGAGRAAGDGGARR